MKVILHAVSCSLTSVIFYASKEHKTGSLDQATRKLLIARSPFLLFSNMCLCMDLPFSACEMEVSQLGGEPYAVPLLASVCHVVALGQLSAAM